MKRTVITILVTAICLCLFISCNIDATDGIYSEIAASTISTNVNIKSYLGSFGGHYYYLSDQGIFRTNSETHVANTSSSIIRSASLTSTGELYVMSQKSDLSTQIDYYSALDASPKVVSGSFKGLLRNGLAYDASNIYTLSDPDLNAPSQILSNVSVRYSLENGDYAFFSVNEGDAIKYYVIKNDEPLPILGVEGTSSTFCAFQPIADTREFVVVLYNTSNATFEAYNLSSSGLASSALFTMKSSLHYAYSTQAASFYYEDGSNKYIVIKASNYFDRYNITDNTIESISTGFATNLRTADIVNINPTSNPKVFVAGTFESMLYEIDMTENKSKQIK